jgi:hypothetical protein
MNSAFYPGAGTDIIPAILFRSIKKWIYMDSQPRSEFGNDNYEGFSRPKFIPKLLKIMDQNEFKLQTIEENIYTFYNSNYDQTIHYETNTVFPDALQKYHRSCDTLVLSRYELTDPPKDFINSYSHIITNSITSHDKSDELIFLSKDISTMVYNENWIYWDATNLTTNKIQNNVRIVNNYLSYDERQLTRE